MFQSRTILADGKAGGSREAFKRTAQIRHALAVVTVGGNEDGRVEVIGGIPTGVEYIRRKVHSER